MVDVSQFHGQKLGGYEMRFPSVGVSNVIECTHYDHRFTPSAVNVILSGKRNEDYCGGTRPGLKAFSGSQPSGGSVYRWLWPNGEVIQWPDGDSMAFSEMGSSVVLPDGSSVFYPHETFSVSASKGDVPSDLSVMSMYRARMVVAKDNMWYASRLGVMDDFDYGGDMDDPSRAVAGNLALSGRKGENITAIAAVRDSALVLATARSLWIVSGEITTSLSQVSGEIGIVSNDAWCFDGLRFWFLGPNGLYAMVLGAGEPPTLMTPHLEGSLTAFKSATLVYDPERLGIHIFGTDGSNSASDWYYDIETKSAWPLKYPSAVRPTAGGVAMLDGRNVVLFTCPDGVFRYWDENEVTDGGTAIVSALAIGPVTHTTGNTENAFLAELDVEARTASANDTANVSLVCDRTFHDATEAAKSVVSAVSSGSLPTDTIRYTFGNGWNAVIRPRVRCNSFAVVVWSDSKKWAISKITAVVRGCGRIRS